MPGAIKIDTWPEFAGQPAVTFERKDGRRYVLFGDDVASPSVLEMPTSRLRRTRIGYQIIGGKAMLLGLLINESSRGSGQGERMIEYFLENVGEREAKFGGTARIHKPVVSLQLARVGLRAEQDDYTAILLPRSNYDETPHVPKITVIRDDVSDRSRIVDRVEGTVFYKEIDPVTARYTYPSGGHTIALHSTFAD